MKLDNCCLLNGCLRPWGLFLLEKINQIMKDLFWHNLFLILKRNGLFARFCRFLMQLFQNLSWRMNLMHDLPGYLFGKLHYVTYRLNELKWCNQLLKNVFWYKLDIQSILYEDNFTETYSWAGIKNHCCVNFFVWACRHAHILNTRDALLYSLCVIVRVS